MDYRFITMASKLTSQTILLLFGLLFFANCASKSSETSLQDRPIKVEYAVVGTSSNNIKHSYMGEIIAQSEIPLSFPMGGRLTSLKVKNGSHVESGQIIATVDNTQQLNLLNSAKAILNQAEDGYERVKQVHDQGGISDVKWVEMGTNLQKAQSTAMSAQKNYDDCTLRAPKNGLVNLQDIQVGVYLAPGQRIGSLLSMGAMRAEFTVPETDVADISVGTPIMVSIPALNRTVNATVSEKSLVSTVMVHAYTVRADIASNDVKDLLQGMVCKANIFSSENEEIVIPSRAVQTLLNGYSVWVIKQGRAERRKIEIGDYVKNGITVKSGLSKNDTIVTLGYQKLFTGAKVEFYNMGQQP